MKTDCISDQNLATKSPEKRSGLLLLVFLLAIPAILQLSGFEVVGGDPDRFFRPLKSELVRQIAIGKLPIWSDLFGFGMPLAGQSEIGAFYPLHYLIYGLAGVNHGYRISMVVHQLIAAFFIFRLCELLGARRYGASIASIIYLFGGFSTIQASKEWAVLGMAWLPGAFLGVEIWFRARDRRGLALIAFSLAALALVGHFQLAQITSLGLLIWVVSRTVLDLSLFRAWPMLMAAVILAICLASPQLILSWNYAREVHATDRSIETLSYYSYPLWNFSELIFPLWSRLLAGGPEGPYWTIHQTTQFEACQYFGTAGLLLAMLGLMRRDTFKIALSLGTIAIVAVLLSTMPQWSENLYASVLKIPGMGLFRCPSRYGVLLHFSVAILAGIGLGQRLGKIPVIIYIAGMMLAFFAIWHLSTIGVPFAGRSFQFPFPKTPVVISGLICAVIAIVFLRLSATRNAWGMALVIFTFIEMFALALSGPTQWGMTLGLPNSSPLLAQIRQDSKSNSDSETNKNSISAVIAGPVDNIPVTLGACTAAAYFGVTMPPANETAKSIVTAAVTADRKNQPDTMTAHLARLGVTHQVRFSPVSQNNTGSNTTTDAFSHDPLAQVILPKEMLDRPIYLAKIDPGLLQFNIEWARVATELPTVTEDDQRAFIDALPDGTSRAPVILTRSNSELRAYPEFPRLDTQAKLTISENRRTIKISYRQPVIVIISRTFDEGWIATDEHGQSQKLLPVNGGLTGLFLDHNSDDEIQSTIHLSYWPSSLNLTLPLSGTAFLAIVVLCCPRKRQKMIENRAT